MNIKKIYKAYKFRMYPSDEQRILLNQFLGCSRFIYNHYLDYKDKIYQEENRNVSLSDLKKDLINLQVEYPWLKEMDSCILRTSLDNLDDAYNRYFKGQNSFPRFKSKNNHDTYKTLCNRSTYKGKTYESIKIDIENKVLTLPKIKEIKVKGYRNLKEFKGKILSATVEKVANKYYVSLCCEEEIMVPDFYPERIVGIDIGVKNIVVTSDGEKYDNLIKRQERLEKRVRGLKTALSRKEKGSNNYKKQLIKIQRVYEKLRNIRKYTIHSITKKIVTENDIIAVESLQTKKMIEEGTRKLSFGISNSSFSEIIRQLTYKSNWSNKRLIKIDKYYPSSQLCCHCKTKNSEVKDLNVRSFVCKNCGCLNDRDINASINILDRGMELFFKEGIIEQYI